jgi:hypothetical protein
MPAAVIGGIIAGAGSLGAAAIASRQAGKATQAETQAGTQALDLQRQIYNDSRQRLEPYNQAGLQGLGGYMSLLGLPTSTLGGLGGGGGIGAGSSTGAAPQYGVTGPSASYLTNMGAISDPSKNGGFAGQVGGTATLGSKSSYNNQTYPSYAPDSQPYPNLRVQAPDGSIRIVPAPQVGEAQQNGGRVLGPA